MWCGEVVQREGSDGSACFEQRNFDNSPPWSIPLRGVRVIGGAWLASSASALGNIACGQDDLTNRVPLGSGVVLELVTIAPGSFQQGSPASEVARGADETQRLVTISRPFFLGKFPVTRGQFAQFVKESGFRTEAEQGTSGGYGFDGTALVQRREFTWKSPGFLQTDEHPVTLVTYPDAKAFCNWLSQKSGRTFSLPSEAQWEYSCRAGSTTAYPNGNDAAALDAIAWFKANSGNGTRAVGQKSLNAWGLGDMLGNVWEWCEDWYAPYGPGPVSDPLQTNPNLSDKPRRVLRGGSWMKDAAACRSAARYRNDARSRNADNGFRVMSFDAARPVANVAAANQVAPTNVPGRISPALEADPANPPAAERPVITRELLEPPRTRARGVSFIGILFFGILLLILVVFVAAIVRALRRVVDRGAIGTSAPLRSGISSRGPLRMRIADDGFWIESSDLPPGAVLSCRYDVGNQSQAREVTWQASPKGEFVFTGARPSNVSVVVKPGSVPSEDSSFRNVIPGESLVDLPSLRRETRRTGQPPTSLLNTCMQGTVFGLDGGDLPRTYRTKRSLFAAGVIVDGATPLGPRILGERLARTSTPILLVRAGAWLCHRPRLCEVPSSATGRPLVAFGAIRNTRGAAQFAHRAADRWVRFLAQFGGDLNRVCLLPRALPEVASVYLEVDAARAAGDLLRSGQRWPAVFQRIVRDRRFRAIHLPELDVHEDSALRVLQLVTTIQIGGAERVTLDLATELSCAGTRVCIAALGEPTRASFPEPPNFADLSHIPNDSSARAQAVAALCHEFAADLVHAHLIRAEDARAIKELGLPLVMTVHNMPQSWPAGLAEGNGQMADLLIACSQAVELSVRERELEIPVRTVWNGIDPKPFVLSPELIARGSELRARLGWEPSDFVLTAVANPRPQKRLDRLPEIVHALQERIGRIRRVRLLLAGTPSEGSVEAEDSMQRLESAIERWKVRDQVSWMGLADDVPRIMAASNVAVSVSAFEGLSLVHLEAIAAGLPVVATDVGGAREIACQAADFHLVPADASAATFARVLHALATRPATNAAKCFPRSFTRQRMAARALSFYPAAIIRNSERSPNGVWLVTNNFSTGGAQASARRLLLGLRSRGINARAMVVEEPPRDPTPGRTAIESAGVPVFAIPPPDSRDPAEAVAQILARIAADPPQSVVFWNLIASYKILLADGLLHTPIYDVSPGAMYHDSLEKYFAQPRPGLPYLTTREYGARLAGVVVKYAAEVAAAAELLGVPVHVIPNGVPLGVRSSARPRRSGKLLIGTAARISPDKRLEDLFEALHLARPRLPPFVIRIAGGVESGQDHYARALKRVARGLPVEWCGELIDVSPFLAALDLFAMISEPAGCPNASLEAMAAGLPVIATDVGGAAEQVVDGVTGRLTPRHDPAAFAEALVEVANDAALRERFGTAAREQILTHFSIDRMIERYLALFTGLQKRPRRGAIRCLPQFAKATVKAEHGDRRIGRASPVPVQELDIRRRQLRNGLRGDALFQSRFEDEVLGEVVVLRAISLGIVAPEDDRFGG